MESIDVVEGNGHFLDSSRRQLRTSNISGSDSLSDRSSSIRASGGDELLRTRARKAHQPASALNSRTSAMYEELNSLNFASLGLYGRDKELSLLQKAYEALKREDSTDDSKIKTNTPETISAGKATPLLNLIMVGGYSGTGKTALVKEFYSRIEGNEKSSLFFVSGRYDPYLSNPYGAFISAFSQLCSDIRSHPLYESKIQEAILQAVGEDYRLLLDLIPNLGELIYEAGGKTLASKATEEYDMVKSKEKFKFLMQRFLQAVCQPEHRLILFLDDVQWMDNASIQLFDMILSDRTLEKSLLIIGTYRNDEIDLLQAPSSPSSTHPVVKVVKQRRAKNLTNVILDNLPLETVESFLADLLHLEHEEVQDLARIAQNRVQGNAFFLIQFLTALRDGGYLKFSIGKMRWEWDGSDIRRSTVVARNVLTVLMEKMEKLPQDAKMVLQVVGCLGANFDEDLVALVIDNLSHMAFPNKQELQQGNQEEKPKRTPKEILTALEEDGILDAYQDLASKQRKRFFCFSHSQIGLAAHELMDVEYMPKLKLQIGKILCEHKWEIDYNSLLFTIVDLWNEGADLVTGSKQIRILVNMNVEAGKKALETFAFGASYNYLMEALDLIPEDKRWEEEFEVSMDIFNCLIKAEYANGSWDQMNDHCLEVVSLKGRPVIEKMVAYTAMIMAFSTQKKHAEAISLAVGVLKELGFKFWVGAAAKLAIISGLLKTKNLLKKVALDTLMTQHEMTDQRRLMALNIMSTVNSSLYAASPDLLMCMVLKTLRWSLKFGISKDTSKCVSFYGLVEMALGNAEAGTEACKLAVKLAEKQKLMDTEYSPTAAVYGFVLPWTNPLHICSKQLLAGYKTGFETGDLHYGFMNINAFCFFCYCTGKPFSNLEEDMREYARQMKEYNQSLQLQFLSLTWQTVLNLMGRCDGEPAILTGEVMDFEEMLQAADAENIAPLRGQIQCHRLQVSNIFVFSIMALW